MNTFGDVLAQIAALLATQLADENASATERESARGPACSARTPRLGARSCPIPT